MVVDMKDVYWLAGLVEGEGCFYLHKRTKMPCIILGMTDRDVIERAAQIFGAQVYCMPVKRPAPRKTIWRINFAGTLAAEWMMTLYSLMGTRRKEQIHKALTAWKSVPAVAKRNRRRFHGAS